MSATVLKFGGSSLACRSDFDRIASYIHNRISKEKSKCIAVVSAPGGMTEWLREWSIDLNKAPSPESTAALLPLADIVGMGLLRVALEAQGLEVTSLSGYQLGLRTDSNFSSAEILQFDVDPLNMALSEADVVVIPGGQGTDNRGRLTWLGKNSSDLTAVAIAAVLKTGQCEVFSDVAGVYSADPNLIKNTQLFNEISYASAIDMSLSGAKMMHYGAIRHAMTHDVMIMCRLNNDGYDIGTRIGIGAHQPAVVTDMCAEIFDFPSMTEQHKAHELLDDANIPVIRLQQKKQYISAITCGFFDGPGFLKRQQITFVNRSVKLVSEFCADGKIRRHIIDDKSAVHFSQQLHDRLYVDEKYHALEG